jgi:hypothetical protein
MIAYPPSILKHTVPQRNRANWLHHVVNLISEALLWGKKTFQTIFKNQFNIN